MMGLSRRSFLLSSAAAFALPALPVVPAAAVPAITKPATMMWICGTPGEMDWRAFNAPTAEQAWLQYCDRLGLEVDEFPMGEDCVDRVAAWDGMQPDQIGPADWLAADYGTICERCDCEIYSGSDGRVVSSGEAVCQACMTIAERVEMEPDSLLDDLMNDIANEGEAEVREKLVAAREWDDLPADLWARAVAGASDT